jgi:hypothetical protein
MGQHTCTLCCNNEYKEQAYNPQSQNDSNLNKVSTDSSQKIKPMSQYNYATKKFEKQ